MLAQAIDGTAAGQLREIGAQTPTPRIESLGPSPQLQKDLLHHLLGVRGLAQHAQA